MQLNPGQLNSATSRMKRTKKIFRNTATKLHSMRKNYQIAQLKQNSKTSLRILEKIQKLKFNQQLMASKIYVMISLIQQLKIQKFLQKLSSLEQDVRSTLFHLVLKLFTKGLIQLGNAKLFVQKKAGAQISSWDMDPITEHANLSLLDAIWIAHKNSTTMKCQ